MSVRRHRSDRYTKTFSTYDHLISLLIGQFSGVRSLRELELVMDHHANKLYHLGTGVVERSTLSDANTHRSFEVFRDIAKAMVRRFMVGGASKELLTVLDSSHIGVAGRGSEWTMETMTRPGQRGLKLHVQTVNGEGVEAIEYIEVSDTNINDISVAKDLTLHADRVYVVDKGYCDYNWWKKIADCGSIFVTRLKKNAAYRVEKVHNIVDDQKGFILRDEEIVLTNAHPRARKTNELAGIPLRLVTIAHPSKANHYLYIVSNALDKTAGEIAGWYKKRWSIELLFKWLKQYLKIGHFLGRSRNAIMIQIYVALIAYILLRYYHAMTNKAARLKDVLTFIRTTLFEYTTPYKPPSKTKQNHRQIEFLYV